MVLQSYDNVLVSLTVLGPGVFNTSPRALIITVLEFFGLCRARSGPVRCVRFSFADVCNDQKTSNHCCNDTHWYTMYKTHVFFFCWHRQF